LSGTHELLIYADDVHILGNEVNSRKKNTEGKIDASKEVDLEVTQG
jgi:hypothetical protein